MLLCILLLTRMLPNSENAQTNSCRDPESGRSSVQHQTAVCAEWCSPVDSRLYGHVRAAAVAGTHCTGALYVAVHEIGGSQVASAHVVTRSRGRNPV